MAGILGSSAWAWVPWDPYNNGWPPPNQGKTFQYQPPPGSFMQFGPVQVIPLGHHSFTGPIGSLPDPVPGPMTIHTFGSLVDVNVTGMGSFFDIPATVTVSVQYDHTYNDGGVDINRYNTEMLALDILGPGFMLRESPTLASTGFTESKFEGGVWYVQSFFDVYMELSMDGGATWIPDSEAPCKMVVPETASTAIVAGLGLVLFGLGRRALRS